jgi:acyl carrier protein
VHTINFKGENMKKLDFIALIEEITEATQGTLTGDENLVDIEGWDSLAVVSFIAKGDEVCGLTLSPSGIANAKSIDDLMNLLGDVIEDR